jgi:hypothetical protein
MKTKEEIQKRINEIMADKRIHYPAANVIVNAPLALVQIELKAEVRTLCWVCGVDTPPFHKEKK